MDNLPAKKGMSWYHKGFVLLIGVYKFGTTEGEQLLRMEPLLLPPVSSSSKCQTK